MDHATEAAPAVSGRDAHARMSALLSGGMRVLVLGLPHQSTAFCHILHYHFTILTASTVNVGTAAPLDLLTRSGAPLLGDDICKLALAEFFRLAPQCMPEFVAPSPPHRVARLPRPRMNPECTRRVHMHPLMDTRGMQTPVSNPEP